MMSEPISPRPPSRTRSKPKPLDRTPVAALFALDPLAEVGAEVEDYVAQKTMTGIADGTAATYQLGWELWCWWAKASMIFSASPICWSS